MGIYGEILTEQQRLLLEANDFNSASTYLSILYQHMIKYQFNPSKQSRSWINTINTSLKNIIKICKNKTILNKLKENQNECYRKGLKEAFKEDAKSYGYLASVKKNIPEEVNDVGYYYSLDNILSNGVYEFLNEYVYHDYVKKHLDGGNNG